MSHVKNVQAFEKLLGTCTGLGGNYKPGKQNLRVPVMHSTLVKAQQALSEVRDSNTLFNNAINHREELFKAADKLASSICNVLEASGASRPSMEDARRACRRLILGNLGSINKEPTTTEAGTSPSKSGFGRDYATRVESFEKLLTIVSKEPSFEPAEPLLTLESLHQHAEAMRAANTAVLQTRLALAKARIQRNEVMYKGETSLYKIVKAVKLYVKGTLGNSHPDYKLLLDAKFVKMVR